MRTHTLTTVGLVAKDVSVIKSLLKLLQQRLNTQWELLYYQPADIVIYDPAQENSAELAALIKPGVLTLCYTQETRPGINCLQKPIKANQLIEVLNRFISNQPEEEQYHSAETIFDPAQYWLGHALKAQREQRGLCIRHLDLPPVWIDGYHQVYYSECDLTRLQALHPIALKQLEISFLSIEAIQANVKRLNLEPHPLNTLIWAATFSLSNGRLLKEHHLEGIVRLTHWPDFSSLQHEVDHFAIALKMIDSRYSLTQIAHETHQPLENIIDLYNACVLTGLADQQTPKTTPAVVINPRTIALFGFSSTEQKALATLILLSKARRQSYTLITPTEQQSAPILLVDHSNPDALQQLTMHIAKTGNTNAIIIPVCSNKLTNEPYCIVRPFTSQSVYSVLDKIPTTDDTTPPPTGFPISTPAHTILVVDDSLAVRLSMEQTLQEYNIKVTSASTGEQAMQLVQAHTYDLIFSDIIMPGMDGYELCRQIKKNPQKKNTPIILLTSKSSPFDKIKGKLAGCDTYLTKPVDKKRFQETLQHYIPALSIPNS